MTNHRILSHAEVTDLTERWHAGDNDARAKLIECNQGLVHKIASRYFTTDPATEYDDLVSHGNLGLLTAIDRFDPKRGVAFSTYAYDWIKQAIQRAVATSGPIRRANWPKRRQKTADGRRAAELRQARVARLDAPLKNEDEDCNTLLDLLAAPDSVEDEALANVETQVVLMRLRPHHRRMVEAWMLGATLDEAGRAGGCSRERARQVLEGLRREDGGR